MPFSCPQDTEEFQKERRSYQSLFYKLNVDVWAPNGSDNSDHGMDYGFEYIEDNQFKGYRIYSQIKSTENLNTKNDLVLFDLKVITASYAIMSAQPYVLFVVDTKHDVAYYVCLQDYFIANPGALESLERNKCTIRIKIPLDNVVTRESTGLQDIAKSQYSFVDGRLNKTR